jgi:hypothetical protein
VRGEKEEAMLPPSLGSMVLSRARFCEKGVVRRPGAVVPHKPPRGGIVNNKYLSFYKK